MKDAYYFSHDSNARHDPKLGAVRAKYGWAGYGLYWAIIEVLRDQPNYSYPNSLLYGLALAIGWHPNDPIKDGVVFDEFIEFLITVGLLKTDGNMLYSDSLIDRMKVLSAYRERLSEAGKIGAEIRWGSHKGANATPIAVKESKVKESNNTKDIVRFAPPTQEEAIAYFKELGSNETQAIKYYDYYQSVGWKVGGRAAMKDWRAAARRWVRTSVEKNGDIQSSNKVKDLIERAKRP